MIKRIILAISFILLAIAGYFGYQYFGKNVNSNLSDPYVNIPTGSDFESVVKILLDKNILINQQSFRSLAARMKYIKPVMRPGRFKIKPGCSNYELIKLLRAGEQSPVKVILNYERLVEQIAGKAGKVLESDSLMLLQTFTNQQFLDSIGFTKDELMSIFLPNTYEMFWNTTPQKFVVRMLNESKSFWEKNNRIEKAKALNLTPKQVYALASIVEKESQNVAERPTIAGVYLNRLKINMKLQADPTCVFASKDFDTKRVTNYHLSFDSPYNTYMYNGLPPGAISIASASSIDAVLNPAPHNYLYFCAKVDASGTHAFAENLTGHNINVAKYIQMLNEKGIR